MAELVTGPYFKTQFHPSAYRHDLALHTTLPILNTTRPDPMHIISWPVGLIPRWRSYCLCYTTLSAVG